ncbi:MAG: hypothetical protein ACR2QQ_02665, partial [Gammaproteobacteria bacterium]
MVSTNREGLAAVVFAVATVPALTQEVDPDTQWSVENLGPSINSEYSDRFSVVSNDGLSLYFASNRPMPGSSEAPTWDIYVSWRDSIEESFSDAVNIGPIVNSEYSDHSASLSPDGLTMYFASDRPGGCGAHDLYVSQRTDARDHTSWSEPVHLGCDVNTELDESCPIVTGDFESNLALLYFTRNYVPGEILYDFYVTQFVIDALEFEPPLPLNELNVPEHDGHFDPNHGLIWSQREGGYGGSDICVTSWIEEFFGWQPPQNIGASINT